MIQLSGFEKRDELFCGCRLKSIEAEKPIEGKNAIFISRNEESMLSSIWLKHAKHMIHAKSKLTKPITQKVYCLVLIHANKA